MLFALGFFAGVIVMLIWGSVIALREVEHE